MQPRSQFEKLSLKSKIHLERKLVSKLIFKLINKKANNNMKSCNSGKLLAFFKPLHDLFRNSYSSCLPSFWPCHIWWKRTRIHSVSLYGKFMDTFCPSVLMSKFWVLPLGLKQQVTKTSREQSKILNIQIFQKKIFDESCSVKTRTKRSATFLFRTSQQSWINAHLFKSFF